MNQGLFPLCKRSPLLNTWGTTDCDFFEVVIAPAMLHYWPTSLPIYLTSAIFESGVTTTVLYCIQIILGGRGVVKPSICISNNNNNNNNNNKIFI